MTQDANKVGTTVTTCIILRHGIVLVEVTSTIWLRFSLPAVGSCSILAHFPPWSCPSARPLWLHLSVEAAPSVVKISSVTRMYLQKTRSVDSGWKESFG